MENRQALLTTSRVLCHGRSVAFEGETSDQLSPTEVRPALRRCIEGFGELVGLGDQMPRTGRGHDPKIHPSWPV